MPGITGIITGAPGQGDPVALKKMVACMIHDRAYVSGTYRNERLGLSVGWTSHAGSFADCMPVWNENKDVCLLFTGEHFADPSEIARLRAAGHVFHGDGASRLVHLYEEYGMKFFELLNGSFSGLLVDLREDKIILFNDRYGLGRIYYYQCDEGFYFATEAKALLRVLPQLRQLDMQSLGEFFACGCALQNRSLFSGVSLLPCGSVWTFHARQGIQKKSYFDPAIWENQGPLAPEQYYDKLKDTFHSALSRHLTGEQRVGMSLTGGLDSRMIMAWPPPGKVHLPCYTFGGPFRECADVKIARRVAAVAHQEFQVIPFSPDLFAEFPSLASRSVYITDGAMDVSGAVGLYVNRLAREIAPVRLTGNYGSEILRGAVAFKASASTSPMFDAQFLPHLQNARATYAYEANVAPMSFIAFKQVPWHHFARFALEQSVLTIRSPYLDNALVALAYQAPADLAVNQGVARRLIADGNPELVKFPTDMGPLGRSGALGRVREMWQTFTFKSEYAYDYGMPQWLAKIDHNLARLQLERLFLGRHKFSHFRVWYRDALAEYVQQVLLDPATLARPYLNGATVRQMVQAHVQGRGNYTTEIHSLLTSELIQRELIAPA